MFDLEKYLYTALDGFANDPADTDYQKGYQAALEEIQTVFWESSTIELTPLGEQQVGA